MTRYPLRMWHDSSGWIHVSSAFEEAAWSCKGWVPEEVFRAQRAVPVPVSSPPEIAVADPPSPPASPGVPAVHAKRGRPRKVAA